MNAINNNTLFSNPYQYAITHSFNDDWSQAFPQFDFHQISLYLQNEMSFNRFKLSYGLRVELPIYPDLGIMENPQVSSATFADYKGNGGKYSTLQLPSTTVMFSPRIGLSSVTAASCSAEVPASSRAVCLSYGLWLRPVTQVCSRLLTMECRARVPFLLSSLTVQNSSIRCIPMA